jgi:hypothetical protein
MPQFDRITKGRMNRATFFEAFGRSTIAVLACTLTLVGCGGGGGGEEPTVTFGTMLQPFYEKASYEAVQGLLGELNIRVIKYQCGYFDMAKLPFEQQGGWVDGRTPRLMFFTVAASDAAAAASIPFPGFGVVTLPQQTNSDPFDCDPAVAFQTPPWG